MARARMGDKEANTETELERPRKLEIFNYTSESRKS